MCEYLKMSKLRVLNKVILRNKLIFNYTLNLFNMNNNL